MPPRAAARAGYVVTFGMKPTAPETGYGYIELGAPLPEPDGVFTRRPVPGKAGRGHRRTPGRRRPAFVELRHVRVHRPHAAGGAGGACARRAAAGAAGGGGRRPPTSTSSAWASRRSAPARRSASTMRWRSGPAKAAVVPADLGWSDVGSWSALWELGAKDAAGNVALGDVVLEGRRTATSAATAC